MPKPRRQRNNREDKGKESPASFQSQAEWQMPVTSTEEAEVSSKPACATQQQDSVKQKMFELLPTKEESLVSHRTSGRVLRGDCRK